MSDDVFVAVLLFCILCFIGGCSFGKYWSKNDLQKDAIRAGHGTMATDQDGEKYFKWR